MNARSAARPVNYTCEPPPGVPRYSGEVDEREVTLHNARLFQEFGLDRSGFEFIRHESALERWDEYQDAAVVKSVVYPEVEAALLAATGADKALIFDHTLRDSCAAPDNPALREPVRRVHDDQTFDSAPGRVRRHLPEPEVARRLARRFAIINLWHPIEQPVQQWPLALCDARSIALDDLIACDHVYPDWTGQTYDFAHSPLHRWYWLPQQHPTEASLLKVYDSAVDGTARLTAHTAFADPTTTPDAPPRRSIEARALVFW